MTVSRRFVTLLAAVGLSISTLTPAQDFSNVEIKTEKLSATTYVLFGRGGNIGVSAGEDALFLIDDQYSPLTPKILEALKKISDKPVKFLLNTHWHGDHTGGNENIGKGGTLIVAQDNVRKRMNSEQFMAFFGNSKVPASPKAALPVVTFGGDVTFHINGDEIYGFHVPNAHTDGDTIIHFRKSNVIHMGDVFFNGFYPFIDAGSGGTPEGVVAAVDKVLAIANDETKIIPGHGPVCNKKDLKVYRDMVDATSTRVRALVKQGKTLEQIIEAKPTADFDERWGKGFIPTPRYIEMLVSTIKK